MCDLWVSDILKGLPTAIIALLIGSIAVWVAHRHVEVMKGRLTLDLFEKRHEVFLATWKFLSDLIQKNPVTTTDIFNYSTSTANAKFLFGNDIVQFLEEAKMKGIKLGTAEYTLTRPQSEEARNEAYAERHELVNWVENELKQVKERFKPYLDLSSLQ